MVNVQFNYINNIFWQLTIYIVLKELIGTSEGPGGKHHVINLGTKSVQSNCRFNVALFNFLLYYIIL